MLEVGRGQPWTVLSKKPQCLHIYEQTVNSKDLDFTNYLHSAPQLKPIEIDPVSLQVQRATSLEQEQGKL
jgi:hypothetical protein